jgi:hypothetical protein
MKGNVRLADLSPSGAKLLYFAEQYKPRAVVRKALGPYDPLQQRRMGMSAPAGRQGRKTPRYLRNWETKGGRPAPRELKEGWTAVSTPPYFAALAIWPSIGRWTGGGVFAAERDIILWERQDGITPIENVTMPVTMRIRPWNHASGPRASAYAPSITESEQHASIAAALTAHGLMWVDWINLRRGDDMLFAGDGRVFRLRRWRSQSESALLSAAEPLVDLREMSFRLMRAPSEAMRW